MPASVSLIVYSSLFLCREDWCTQREIKDCFQIPTATVDCSNSVISAAIIAPIIYISRLNSILALRI